MNATDYILKVLNNGSHESQELLDMAYDTEASEILVGNRLNEAFIRMSMEKGPRNPLVVLADMLIDEADWDKIGRSIIFKIETGR